MQTSFASPTGFGGALTDPPWSLSGETARMKKTVLPGSALLGGKVGEKWKFEKKICGTVRRNMLLFLPQSKPK